MDILVTGGLGFLGSHLVDRLLGRAGVARIVVVDNLWTGRRDNLAHVDDPRLQVRIQDVEAPIADGPFDEIYHLASPAAPRWYMTEPLRAISANVVGAFNLLRVLRPGGCIAYMSTSEVYGDTEISPQHESNRGWVDCTGPRASYDEGKRCTESILFEAHRVEGVRIKVVRLFNVYGPRTRPDDGRAVSNFVAQALRGDPMTIYGDGSQVRSWGYVDDIIEALERYFWRDGSDFPGPLNIGSDREVPVIDIARYIQGRVPGSRIAHLPPAPQDPVNRRPDLRRAREIIPGWEPSTTFDTGIDKTIAWFEANAEALSATPIDGDEPRRRLGATG